MTLSSNCKQWNAHLRCTKPGCSCDCHGSGCPITVFPNEMGIQRKRQVHPVRCDKPIQPGAKFCVKHEADRIRLLRGVGH